MFAALFTSVAFLLFPTQASAFPVAEGASSASALFGGIAALLAGGAVGLSGGRTRQLVLICSALVVVALTSVSAHVLDAYDRTQEAVYIRRSLPSAGLEPPLAPPPQTYDLSQEDRSWLQQSGLLVDGRAYQRGVVAPDAIAVYVSADASEKDQPAIAPRFSNDDHAGLLDFARNLGAPLILVSESLRDLAAAGRFLNEAGISDFHILPAAGLAPRMEASASVLPMYDDPDGIFEQRVVDTTSARVLQHTHNTLHNAANIPSFDLLMMRDREIREGLDWPAIITSWQGKDYASVDLRLRAAGLEPGRDYSFYEGGLERHFETHRHSVVPYHYNLRLADPNHLMRVALLTDRLRFICTRPDQCLENIPSDLRIDIPFADIGKEAARARIEALDPSLLYTTISSSQDTSVNALSAGWWLISSGHDYLGELILHERFSLKRLWERMGYLHGQQSRLSDWREARAPISDGISTLRSAIEDQGWLVVIAGLGLLARLCAAGSISAVSAMTRKFTTVVAPFLHVGVLVGTYWLLDHLISYYAIIPHSEMQELLMANTSLPGHLLAATIGAHLAARHGIFSRHAAILFGIVALLWGAGLFHGIPDPLAAFLIASEAMAVFLAMPALLRRTRNRRDASRGVIRTVDDFPSGSDMPEKWALMEEFRSSPGFLADLSEGQRDAIVRSALALNEARIILRSASPSRHEQDLGGFHSSPIVDRTADAIQEGLSALYNEGCRYAWVQPYQPHASHAVLSSIGPGGERGFLVSGPGDSATEGGRDVQQICLANGRAKRSYRRAWRLLRKVERHCKGPVVLEIGFDKGRTTLFQIRRQSASPVAPFHPHGIKAFTLAEDYLATCSRLTGTALMRATRKDFVYSEGFLYRRKRPIPALLAITPRRVELIESEVLAIARCAADDAETHASRLESLDRAIALLGRIYRASQSRWRPANVQTRITSGLWVHDHGPELDMATPATVHLERLGHPGQVPTRQALHDMAVLTGLSIGMICARLTGSSTPPADLHLDELFNPDFRAGPDLRRNQPHTDRKSDATIVPGEITGRPWPVEDGPPPEGVSGLILVGEEIGSEWVRHLDRFEGILSVYGGASSHLGMSARHLGIPYRKISRAELDRLRAQHAQGTNSSE